MSRVEAFVDAVYSVCKALAILAALVWSVVYAASLYFPGKASLVAVARVTERFYTDPATGRRHGASEWRPGTPAQLGVAGEVTEVQPLTGAERSPVRFECLDLSQNQWAGMALGSEATGPSRRGDVRVRDEPSLACQILDGGSETWPPLKKEDGVVR